MQDTKVHFSEKEVRVLSNSEVFYIKEEATEKLFRLLENVRLSFKQTSEHQNFSFPSGTDVTSGKVSKGENYRQLPYVILDFPKLFSRETIFAFRTLFWWGHHFSFTLHLQGEALETYRPKLLQNIDQLKSQNDIYCCVNDTPWNHSFEPDNYRPTAEMDRQTLETKIRERSFMKLARKLPPSEWEKVISKATDTYRLTLQILQPS